MSLAMLLKIFSDCCVVFAILGSGPVSFRLPLLIPGLICGVSAAIATFFDGKGLKVLRWLCAVLPLSCLLLADGTGQLVILAVPTAYTVFVILRGELELEYYNYRRFFLRTLTLIGGAYVLVNVWAFLSQITSDAPPILNADVMLRYGIVHLLCGVVLQRQLRLGVGYRAEGGRRQMAMMLGTAGTIVLGFIAAEPLLRKGAGTLLKSVLSLLLTPFAFLLDLAGRLFAMLTRSESDKQEYEEFVEYLQGVLMDVEQLTGKPQKEPSAAITIDPADVWTVLAGILLLIAALLLLRSFHKRRADSDTSQQISRLVTAPKKKKEPVLSNRNRVRQMYRDFLRAEKDLGMKLKICDTSEDVLRRIHRDTDQPSAEQLRAVYLMARYDDRQGVSRNQAETAKRALKGTRKSKN